LIEKTTKIQREIFIGLRESILFGRVRETAIDYFHQLYIIQRNNFNQNNRVVICNKNSVKKAGSTCL